MRKLTRGSDTLAPLETLQTSQIKAERKHQVLTFGNETMASIPCRKMFIQAYQRGPMMLIAMSIPITP